MTRKTDDVITFLGVNIFGKLWIYYPFKQAETK